MKEAVEMLVLPIKTLLGHYIYDANRNEITTIMWLLLRFAIAGCRLSIN